MRLLKKFNQYMLENHPLTWHSKFIQLMAAGLLFWLISFVCGYLMVNLDVIQRFTIERYYERSSFISFHVIYCLIVICIWAIFFYKNNAIKSFYPLQRFYLVRMFLQLFVAFSLLVSAYYPFTAGCNTKVKSLLPKEAFENDIDKLNFGSAFLVRENTIDEYYFTEREDFLKLGYEYASFDEEEGEWEESYEYYYYPELLDDQYVPNQLAYRNFVSENDSIITVIEGKKFLFFSTVEKYTGPDSCSSITLVKDLHKLELKDLSLYAFNNYNSWEFSSMNYSSNIDFQNAQLAKIHRWTTQNQKDSIEEAISGLMEVCKKYELTYNLNPKVIANYLQAKNYSNLESFIYDYAHDEDNFLKVYPADHAMIMKYSTETEVDTADAATLIHAMENQQYMNYDTDRLETMISNYKSYSRLDVFAIVLVTFYISFFLAWLFLFFEFANIISLLITIPIGGVLAILVGVSIAYLSVIARSDSMYSMNFDRHWIEKASIAIVFGVCLIILSITVFGLFQKQFSKRILNIFVNLSYMIAPIFISLFFGMMYVFSGHYEYVRCESSVYEYEYNAMIQPAFHLLYAFIGICVMFPLIIKWRAKEE